MNGEIPLRKKLAILLSLIAGTVFLTFLLRDAWTLTPFRWSEPYTNISRMTVDSTNSLYTITHSKKTLMKVDEESRLVYSLPAQHFGEANSVPLFDSITADDQGNAYALVTILDSYGLKVLGEQIVQISNDGANTRVLYHVHYQDSDNLFRVGNIQSLSIHENELYFFQKDKGAARLWKLPLDAGPQQQPQLLSAFQLPDDSYLNEATGNQTSPFFLTTKRGRLLFVSEGKLQQLYPQSAKEQLHFPIGITTKDHVHVYFIDHHDYAIKRINTNVPGTPVEVLLNQDKLANLLPDTEWSSFTHIAINNGKIIVSTSDQIIWMNPNGTVLDIQHSYRYSLWHLAERFGYWLLLFGLAALVVYTSRFVYVEVMKRKVFLLLKQLAVILPVVLVSMATLSYAVYSSFATEMRDDTYKQLKLLAGNGKYLVDGKHLVHLQSPQDYMSTDYQTIKQRVKEVFSRVGEDRDGLYNTIYRYMDGQLYVVMDDDDSVVMFQPFDLTEENLPVIEQGEVVLGEWEDATGEWVYALGPLYDTNGEIVGIYETGKDMNVVKQSNLKILYAVLQIFGGISLVLLIAITIMTVYLLSSIRTLRRHVNLIASGEWDVRVDIRTRDEVEELGERFNMMASSINQYISEITRLSHSYFRFVPQQFLSVLGKTNMTQIRLGEQQNRRMTIMVCNMRQFNQFYTKLSTEENFQFVNSFLKHFGPVIREYGGFTSRYLGPGMLTMFPNDAAAALQAARKLRVVLDQYNEDRIRQQLEPIDIGIAIHSGDVMLGIIGEEQRLEGSVVSNHVQMALDLERVSAKLGVNILLTEETRLALREGELGHYRRLGALQLDDEQEPIELYDLYDGDPVHIRELKHETKEQFEKAIEAFRQGRFYDAREGFVAVMKKNRYDLAAKLYFFECDRYFQKGAAAEWNLALRIS